jgi:hypothetical protein
MPTLREQIDNSEFPMVRELMGGLYDEIQAAIVVPNELLPKRYHQHKAKDVNGKDEQIKGRSLKSLEKIYKSREKLIEKRENRAERKRRVELYRSQFLETGKIEHEPFVFGQDTRTIDLS